MSPLTKSPSHKEQGTQEDFWTKIFGRKMHRERFSFCLQGLNTSALHVMLICRTSNRPMHTSNDLLGARATTKVHNNNEKSKNQTNIHKNENASHRIKFLLRLG
jgi:hypothetical protein